MTAARPVRAAQRRRALREMVAKAENQASWVDTAKLWLAVGLLGGGIFGFYWFGDQSPLYRALGLLAVAIVVIGIAYTTSQGRRMWRFAQDARTELRKVVWPTRTETIQTTLVVLVVVLLVGIFLWLLDMLLQWGFGVITGVGS